MRVDAVIGIFPVTAGVINGIRLEIVQLDFDVLLQYPVGKCFC